MESISRSFVFVHHLCIFLFEVTFHNTIKRVRHYPHHLTLPIIKQLTHLHHLQGVCIGHNLFLESVRSFLNNRRKLRYNGAFKLQITPLVWIGIRIGQQLRGFLYFHQYFLTSRLQFTKVGFSTLYQRRLIGSCMLVTSTLFPIHFFKIKYVPHTLSPFDFLCIYFELSSFLMFIPSQSFVAINSYPQSPHFVIPSCLARPAPH